MGATPASLLDLIARGGSMQVGIDQNKERALTEAALANAVQSKAAAKELEAQTAKHNAELEAFNQVQADNQVISDAFAHVGGNRSMMDKYIKANASGAGVMRWQMENEKLREQASKASAADLDRAEKVHKVMGSSLGYLNDVPDEQLQAEYAKVAPQIQQLDPSIKLPPQIDRMGLKRIMGQLAFADEILKSQKEQAEIEGRRQQTEAATKDAALKERAAFLQGVRPDMPYSEYKALPGYDKFAKVYPSPAAAAAAAKVEGIAVKDRAKVEQEARVLSGMSPTGITAEQQAKLAADAKVREEQARHNRQMEGLQASAQRVAQANSGVQREGMLRDDFAKESKNFVAIRDAYGKVKQAASTDSAAADVALIYGFMRILDPTSTVREGEFATAQNAGSIPDRVVAAYNRAISGGRLSPNIRQDFVKQTEKIYGQADKDHQKTEQFFGDVAKRYGMDPKQVLPDYRSTFSDKVKLVSPDGKEQMEVSPDQAEFYIKKGARKVQ